MLRRVRAELSKAPNGPGDRNRRGRKRWWPERGAGSGGHSGESEGATAGKEVREGGGERRGWGDGGVRPGWPSANYTSRQRKSTTRRTTNRERHDTSRTEACKGNGQRKKKKEKRRGETRAAKRREAKEGEARKQQTMHRSGLGLLDDVLGSSDKVPSAVPRHTWARLVRRPKSPSVQSSPSEFAQLCLGHFEQTLQAVRERSDYACATSAARVGESLHPRNPLERSVEPQEASLFSPLHSWISSPSPSAPPSAPSTLFFFLPKSYL